ncbi:hypothetical protein Taro_044558 [Colocasia esculenta]|uniref:CCHC-type domain-containing protein n=1 Tax=Colocasia esculenta TaxID=4460 RepID=A0A843WNZ9_COLES|nr:hypothetical protein [Colocasia esculenta]
MVQRAQLVEDTMAKVEGMRGKDNSKPVFVKKGAPNTAPSFCNNNFNNNNKKRLNAGREFAENCKFCDKPGHRAEECWKKIGACLRCGGRDHRIPDCPMMKDQPGKTQNVPRRQGRLNAAAFTRPLRQSLLSQSDHDRARRRDPAARSVEPVATLT